MLIMDLLIPLIMLSVGQLFVKKPPETINGMYGYRTSMSMKNKDTWEFAHKYCGKIWRLTGAVLLLVSIGAMLCLANYDTGAIGTAGGVLCGVQTLVMIVSVLPTERALRKAFDKNGCRR
jgi:uncharacterized membrane protein